MFSRRELTLINLRPKNLRDPLHRYDAASAGGPVQAWMRRLLARLLGWVSFAFLAIPKLTVDLVATIIASDKNVGCRASREPLYLVDLNSASGPTPSASAILATTVTVGLRTPRSTPLI